jgi:hypothetical protein
LQRAASEVRHPSGLTLLPLPKERHQEASRHDDDEDIVEQERDERFHR